MDVPRWAEITWPLFLAAGAFLCAVFSWALGALSRRDGPVPVQGELRGFTAGGLGAGLLCGAGWCLLAAGLLFSRLPGWAAALCALAALSLLTLLPHTLGYVQFERAEAGLGRTACLAARGLGNTLGALLSLPSTMAAARAAKAADVADLSEEAALQAVDVAEGQSVIDEDQKEMIENIFELDDRTAGDAMTHRTDMTAVSADASAMEVVAIAVEEGFSRMPVYGKDLDDIVGILYVKDLLGLLRDETMRGKTARELARSVMFVPESCRIRELIQQFRDTRTQVAVVVDEYGGTSGLVTMEDVLEEIVGDMQDEFDDEEEAILPADGGYICDGAADLDELLALFDASLDEDEEPEADSVGGLVINRIGRIPAPGEDVSVVYRGIVFQVMASEERRVRKVFCRRAEAPAAEEE